MLTGAACAAPAQPSQPWRCKQQPCATPNHISNPACARATRMRLHLFERVLQGCQHVVLLLGQARHQPDRAADAAIQVRRHRPQLAVGQPHHQAAGAQPVDKLACVEAAGRLQAAALLVSQRIRVLAHHHLHGARARRERLFGQRVRACETVCESVCVCTRERQRQRETGSERDREEKRGRSARCKP